MKHKHFWLYVDRGHGVGPKKNDPDPEIFDGNLEVCTLCGKKRFVPDNPKYKPQEVVE